MKYILCGGLLFVLSGFPASLSADQVFLKNGEILNGKVLSINRNTIGFIPDGDLPFRLINADKASKVTYDDGREVAITPSEQEIVFPKIDLSPATVAVTPVVEPEKPKPVEPPRQKSPFSHDGLNVRFMSGVGYGQTSLNSVRSYTFNGLGFPSTLATGYGFHDNWVFHLVGGYRTFFAGKPETNSTTLNSKQKNQRIDTYEYGCGLSYYILPSDYFATLSLTTQRFIFHGDFVHGKANTPISVSLHVGKEWRIFDNFSIGAAVMGTYSKTSASNTNSLSTPVSNIFTGIMLTTSYRL
jgi:hypothetical protein